MESAERVRVLHQESFRSKGASAVARIGLALSLVAAVTLAACGGESSDSQKDEGDIVTRWEAAGRTDMAIAIKKSQLFEKIAEALNDGFKFPHDLPVIHRACGEENAFYDPEAKELSMCYELLDQITNLAAQDPSTTDEEFVEDVIAVWTFVFFHELGHGLIDMYELPTTGREEDAVDGFSTVLLIEAGLSDYAITAAEYWAATDSGMYDQLSYADEHSLNAQRFYDILCLVYGSDPQAYSGLVGTYLPQSRAVRCPAEYEKQKKSWETLLEPWSK